MTTYNDEWTDEEWREQNFSTVALHSAVHAGVKQPSAKELIGAAERFGVEGVLESAVLLPQKDYRKVEEAVKRLKGGKRGA